MADRHTLGVACERVTSPSPLVTDRCSPPTTSISDLPTTSFIPPVSAAPLWLPASINAPSSTIPAIQSPLKRTQNPKYMHRPPRIVPNYGKKHHSTLLKSNITRVLLYDNIKQQQMLNVKISHIGTEERRTGRLMDLHRRSFIIRCSRKRGLITDTTLQVNHNTFRPVPTARSNHRQTNGISVQPETALTADDVHGNEETGSTEKGPAHVTEHHVTVPSESTSDGNLAEEDDKTVATSKDEKHTSLPPLFPELKETKNITNNLYGVCGGESCHTSTAVVYRELDTSNSLPDINSTSGSEVSRPGKLVLHKDDKQGLTCKMHTFHQTREWGGLGGDSGRRRREVVPGAKTTEDDRYRELEKLLVRIKPPNEGYLELSPSFHSPRQMVSFSGSSPFYSSVVRSRSFDSSISTQ